MRSSSSRDAVPDPRPRTDRRQRPADAGPDPRYCNGLSGESAGGIAPPAARRTVRKPLGLHGSHRPAIRFEAEAPVSEQARRASGDADQEEPCPFLASAEPFELAHGPAHQVVVDAPQKGIQHGLVEAPIEVDPPLHDAVEHQCQIVEGLVTAPGDVPGTDLPTHRRDHVLADRREETHEMLSPPVLGQPRTKRVPQERERRDLMIVTPVRVLAVSGSPGESHPRAPTERSVTVSGHSALTIQSAGTGESMPSARTAWGRVARPLATTPSDA